MKPRKAKQRLPMQLASLPAYKQWLRALPGASAPKPHDDRDAARGIVHSAIVLIIGYAVLGFVIATALAGCGGGGGSSGASAQKPSANTPADPTTPQTPAPPTQPSGPEPGAYKAQSKFCVVLGADAVCRVGESDSTWLAAADVNAARVPPVSFPHADGTYTGTLDGVAMTVSVAGATITGQSSAGCVLNGSWVARDQLFDFTGSASCRGAVQLQGLIIFVSSDGGPTNGVKMLLAARGGSSQRISFVADGAPNPEPSPTDCTSRAKPANETRFTTCPVNTGPGSFTQSRVAVCSTPPEWSWSSSWTPAQPSASECPPAPPPPPSCGAAPPDGVRTSTECPAGLQGSWQQTHGWQAVAFPTCYEPTAWVPDSAPADACQLPPPPAFGMWGRWGWQDSAEFCDVQPDGAVQCVLSYNSSQQLMHGSVLPGGVGVTRALKDGVLGPERPWQFLEWATDANGNRLTLVFGGAGAPPGSGILADMRRVQP